MAIDRTETKSSSPIFSEINPSDSVFVRRAKILKQFAPRMGKRAPYGSSELELVSPIGRDARLALVRGMVALPGTEGLELFRASANLEYISDKSATSDALERMYKGPVPEEDADSLDWSRLFMENIHNAMAVRNRLRIVRRVFTARIEKALSRTECPLQVLSIAAGSSRAIMESLVTLNGAAHDRISLQMVDNSKNALKAGQQLVGELGIKASVKFTEAGFLPINAYLEDKDHPEFVEIVGLMDYLQDGSIVRLLRNLKGQMTEGGSVLFSNITPNDEQEFTHKVVGWQPMIYRTTQDLARLATKSGFDSSKVEIIKEPLGVYNLALVTK